MVIENRINKIKESFSAISDWEDRYREIIKIGRSLEELEEEFWTEKFKIKGCQSQVWLKPSYQGGKVFFKAASDTVLVKGIIGLLVKVYSDSSPQDILSVKADFLKDIGITEHLSMNRTNGLASMIKQIQMYAFVYKSLADQGVMDANEI